MDFKQFYKTINFDIDNEIRTVFQATQGDTKSRGLLVDLIVGGVKTPVTTEGMTFFALKPDGTRVMTAGVKEGSGFRIDFTNQTFAVPGVLLCTLVLSGTNGEKIADKKFKMTVDSSLEDGAIISEDERGILDRAFDLATDIVPRLEGLDVPLLENLEQEVILARGAEPTLGARLDGSDAQLAEIEQEIENLVGKANKPQIPIYDFDPINPEVGEMWVLKPAIARDDFRGEDGEALNSRMWEVVKTKSINSIVEHASTNDIFIKNNAMQFNLGAAAAVEDGGSVAMSARMKKFQIDWTSGKRTIIWKQQPFSWASPWGLVLATTIPVEGGDLFSDYAIRVTHNSTNTSLQIIANGVLVYNKKYLHEATSNDMYEYELAIDPDGNNIILYQGGVQKLTSPFPNFGFSKAWMYFVCRVAGLTTIATVKNIDDVIIR